MIYREAMGKRQDLESPGAHDICQLYNSHQRGERALANAPLPMTKLNIVPCGEHDHTAGRLSM